MQLNKGFASKSLDSPIIHYFASTLILISLSLGLILSKNAVPTIQLCDESQQLTDTAARSMTAKDRKNIFRDAYKEM